MGFLAQLQCNMQLGAVPCLRHEPQLGHGHTGSSASSIQFGWFVILAGKGIERLFVLVRV